MRRILNIIVLFFFIVLSCTDSGTTPQDPEPVMYKSTSGAYTYSTAEVEWKDGDRSWDLDGIQLPNREIPIKIYAPDENYSGTFPLILISHGMGGNCNEALAYLGEHLASHGYIAVSVQHHRSDSDYLALMLLRYGEEQGFTEFLLDAQEEETRALRPGDITFVLNTILNENANDNPLLAGRIDEESIAVMGHSFGAFTTLAMNGMVFDGDTMADSRISCGIAFSPQGDSAAIEPDGWENITNPLFTMTGTMDTSLETPDPVERREPYDGMPVTPGEIRKYLMTFSDAEHADFGNENSDGFYHSWIKQLTIAFFDAYLLDDTTALNWLQRKEIEKITTYANLEMK